METRHQHPHVRRHLSTHATVQCTSRFQCSLIEHWKNNSQKMFQSAESALLNEQRIHLSLSLFHTLKVNNGCQVIPSLHNQT